MPRYEVFLNPPSIAALRSAVDHASCHWQTSHFKPETDESPSTPPPATLAAASRRIKSIYGGVIWDQDDEDVVMYNDESEEREERVLAGETFMTWEPTRLDAATTFLRSRIADETQPEAFQSVDSYEASGYSDGSSLGRLPLFHFSLNALTTLATVRGFAAAAKGKGGGRATLLLAVLEADGPDTVTLKQGPDRGREVAVMRLLCGDEDGEVAKITAWRESAEEMGGAGAKRGDIIHVENLHATWDAAGTLSFMASPQYRTRTTVCYRTLPDMEEDRALRPDLRLAASEPAVRKVQSVVGWFETLAGLR